MQTFDDIHSKFETKAATLKAEGIAGVRSDRKNMTREEWRDEQTRWAFWRAHTRNCQADRDSSDEWLFMQAVWGSIDAAREDERERIARVISNGLKSLLEEEFFPIMFDIAEANDINIGYDW